MVWKIVIICKIFAFGDSCVKGMGTRQSFLKFFSNVPGASSHRPFLGVREAPVSGKALAAGTLAIHTGGCCFVPAASAMPLTIDELSDGFESYPRANTIDVMSEITQILQGFQAGQPESTSKLLSLVYNDLRQLAAQKLRNESPGHSLQATALVHEAFLRLVGSDGNDASVWQNRSHFFGAAAEAMRRILVDSARRRKAKKRGGDFERSDLDVALVPAPTSDDEILAIDEVLDRLADVDADAARLVKLRFFAGMTMSEIADLLEISVRSTHDIWAYARAWLRNEIGK